jgi:hypothetical protein
MKGTWHDVIRVATAEDLLSHYIVLRTCNGDDEIHWQIQGGILYHKGEGDTDCLYISPTTYSGELNLSNEIMSITCRELAHFGPNKFYQYTKVYFF